MTLNQNSKRVTGNFSLVDGEWLIVYGEKNMNSNYHKQLTINHQLKSEIFHGL